MFTNIWLLFGALGLAFIYAAIALENTDISTKLGGSGVLTLVVFLILGAFISSNGNKGGYV